MEEKKGLDILRRELGRFYTGQSFEELQEYNFLSGFYVKTCHEEKIESKSDILMELQMIEMPLVFEKRTGKPFVGDPYEAVKLGGDVTYTGFTSMYVSDAIELKVALIPNIVHELIEEDVKHGTSIETILSRASTCLKSIAGGKFLDGLLAKCSNGFVGLWKVWFDIQRICNILSYKLFKLRD